MPDVSPQSSSLFITHPELLIPVKKLELDIPAQAAILPPPPAIDLRIPNEPSGGIKVTVEVPVERMKTLGIYTFDTLSFQHPDEGRIHLMRAIRVARGLFDLLAHGHELAFWFPKGNRTEPYYPMGYDCRYMPGNDSVTINMADRLNDHLTNFAKVVGVTTASDAAASAWVMLNTIREKMAKGGYLKILFPPSHPARRKTIVLQ